MLTTQQVMEILQVSRPTIHHLIREGYLRPAPFSPALKRPKRNYFRPEDVERVLRDRRRDALEQRKAS